MKNIVKITAVTFCLMIATAAFAQTDNKKQQPAKQEATPAPAKTETQKDGGTNVGGKQKMAITEQGVNKNNKKKSAATNTTAADNSNTPPATEPKK